MSRALSTNKRTGQQAPVGGLPPTTTKSASMDLGRRKLSTRSKGKGHGLLHRKSTKTVDSHEPKTEPSPAEGKDSAGKLVGRGSSGQLQEQQQQQSLPQPQQPQPANVPVRSIIPDPLAELPEWYASDADWAVTSAAQFRAKYPVNNPAGPRYYRNHHLLPPPEARPPSVFSPAFPPMAATGEHAHDHRRSTSSRTPSGSPLPTPNSSQVRIHDLKVRPRKISQTAQDNADVLEGMDPWGTNLHHRSPYDVGNHDRSSPDLAEQSPTVSVRPRRASLSHPIRHKTTIPSPLSQSTSAVHLTSDPLSTHLPRRLSKSRRSLRGLFGGSNSHSSSSMSRSAPGDHSSSLGRKVSRSVPPSISSSSASLATTGKAKRGSILGRIARRFSLMRKSNTSPSLHESVRSGRQSLSTDTYAVGHQLPSQPQRSPTDHDKVALESSKRVPPPPIDSMDAPAHYDRKDTSDSQSILSVDPSYTTGKLQVANPDEPMPVKVPLPIVPAPPVAYGIEPPSSERIMDVPLRHSPSSMDTPDFHHIPHTALSVISEGETYMSTPRSKPMTAFDASPTSPPTIPSLLSQSAYTTSASSDVPEPPSSPPLPELPPPTPVSKGAPSLPPPTPVSKGELSLPPTPSTERAPSPSPTPVVKEISLPSTTSTVPYALQSQISERTRTSMSIIEDDHDVLPDEMPSFSRRAPYVDNDPLARVSIIANPPTPFSPSLTISLTPSTVQPALPQTNGEKTHDMSPKKDGSQRSTRSRRTETFKLVRSSSDDFPEVGNGFVVEGEHWEVVESPVDRSPTKKSKRSADGKRRESSPDDSEAQRKHSVHRKSSSGHDRRTTDHDSHRIARARSTDIPHHTAPERRSSTKERHSSEGSRATQTPIIYVPRIATVPAVPTGHIGASIERRTSVSASPRPTSELQPTADLNALKAKDAWEMERLWRGRSVFYGTDNFSAPTLRPHISSDSRPTTIMSADLQRASTIPSMGDSGSNDARNHGSNHTYYVVQTPHEALQNGYSQYPSSHPPGIYTTTPRQGTSDPYQQPTQRRSFSDNVSFPSLAKVPDLPLPRPNPLPEPPRLSAYKMPPLPPSLASIGSSTPA